VLYSADQSAVSTLPPEYKTAFDTLTANMWASFKPIFRHKKERIAMSSTEFRAALRKIRSYPQPLFGSCRRTKFVLASMDVGFDTAKYASERRSLIGKLINKIVLGVVKVGLGAGGVDGVGGDAAAAIVSLVAELVDNAFDESKTKLERKYAAAGVLLSLLSGFVPPTQDVPVRRVRMPSSQLLTLTPPCSRWRRWLLLPPRRAPRS
jgi:hypothetical protein